MKEKYINEMILTETLNLAPVYHMVADRSESFKGKYKRQASIILTKMTTLNRASVW